MFRLKDRKGADMCLGMTHEEVFTTIARNEIRSYKQLPQVWYQIQIKFRDEARPKSGLMRLRTFIMKDAYTFDVDRAGLDKAFLDQRDAYQRIFSRCGIEFSIVEASSGSIGGSESNEFMAKTDAGEDLIASCSSCDYAANIEKATSGWHLPTIWWGPTRQSSRRPAYGRSKTWKSFRRRPAKNQSSLLSTWGRLCT